MIRAAGEFSTFGAVAVGDGDGGGRGCVNADANVAGVLDVVAGAAACERSSSRGHSDTQVVVVDGSPQYQFG